jgi:hypothetical protein
MGGLYNHDAGRKGCEAACLKSLRDLQVGGLWCNPTDVQSAKLKNTGVILHGGNQFISKTASLSFRLRISVFRRESILVRGWCLSGASPKISIRCFMEDRFRTILESIPKKRQRSRLESYTELIDQLRRRGHTYREITRILAEKCDLVVASSTQVRFMAARSKEKRKRPKHYGTRKTRSAVPANIKVNINPTFSDDDLRKRIEALKQRPAKTAQTSKQFDYDPDQPLRLPRKE